MKYTNEQVSSAFAAGRAAASNNMKTDGQRLWSYGTMIGTKLNGLVILSSDRMSPTTGKHLSLASRAFHYNVIYADVFSYGSSNPLIVPDCVVESLAAAALDEASKAQRARVNRSSYLTSAKMLFEKSLYVAKQFGLNPDNCYPSDMRQAIALAGVMV